MAVVRNRRDRYIGMGRLDQSQAPAGAGRQHPVNRGRTKLPRHD